MKHFLITALVLAQLGQLLAQPVVTGIAPTQITVTYPGAAHHGVRFGTDKAHLSAFLSPGNADFAQFTLSSLQPGTVYWVQPFTVQATDTVFEQAYPVVTQSLSSGQIDIYFNHTINTQFVGNKQPSAVTDIDCLNAIIQKINNAKQTLDVALYNNNRDDIVTALKNAHTRGVRVRYVAAAATQNSALEPPPAFPVVYGNEDYLMHNKFMVIDADLPNDAWVMGGSMNWTTSNIFNDYNNMVFVQDQSLAQAYELEFEEMWGSTGAQPNAANQHFGNDKTDNTPHNFVIGGVPVELWFSPSDQVTDRIVSRLETANSSVEFALLTFTKNEPADVLIEHHSSGTVNVRGLIENINDTGSEYAYLLAQGIEVGDHFQQYQLHHKYAVIDALLPNSDPTVWTGSHNWTFTADNYNDENSLVFHNADIARLYRAEFEARISENPVSVVTPAPLNIRLSPNPATETFQLGGDLKGKESPNNALWIYTPAGQLVLEHTGPLDCAFAIGHLPTGLYIVKVATAHGFVALPLQKVSR